MKILIGLAGDGTRFKEAGYKTIKPLIRTGNMPMIQKVVDSFNWPNAEYYFITRQDHLQRFPYLKSLLESMGHVTVIDKLTRGAAESLISCKPIMESNEPFISLNCDQVFEWDTSELQNLIQQDSKVSWLTVYQSLDENKHSFALPPEDKVEEDFSHTNPVKVAHVSGKTRLGIMSPTATTGFYHFFSGKEFYNAVQEALQNPPEYGGEYYVGPIYNKFIKKNFPASMYKVHHKTFWPTGTIPDYIDYNHRYFAP